MTVDQSRLVVKAEPRHPRPLTPTATLIESAQRSQVDGWCSAHPRVPLEVLRWGWQERFLDVGGGTASGWQGER